MSVLHNLIYRFRAIPVKISAIYFVDINKLILKLIRRDKRPIMGNRVMKEKNEVGELTISDVKTYYKSTIV